MGYNWLTERQAEAVRSGEKIAVYPDIIAASIKGTGGCASNMYEVKVKQAGSSVEYSKECWTETAVWNYFLKMTGKDPSKWTLPFSSQGGGGGPVPVANLVQNGDFELTINSTYSSSWTNATQPMDQWPWPGSNYTNNSAFYGLSGTWALFLRADGNSGYSPATVYQDITLPALTTNVTISYRENLSVSGTGSWGCVYLQNASNVSQIYYTNCSRGIHDGTTFLAWTRTDTALVDNVAVLRLNLTNTAIAFEGASSWIDDISITVT
jgi:hypothetical protein